MDSTNNLVDLCRDLSSSPLLPVVGSRELVSRYWTQVVLCADAPASQYDVLRRVVARHGSLPGPVACLALTGCGFHGQHGRSWAAATGNLHLSLALPCDLEQAGVGPALPMLAAVAVRDALVGFWPADEGDLRHGPAIKWVNDVLVDDRKLAGVLTALRTEAGRIRQVFLGIGVNIRVAPRTVADPFGADAICLAALPLPAIPTLGDVLTAVLFAVETRLTEVETAGVSGLVEAYRAASLVVGRRVGVWEDARANGPPTMSGVVTRIHSDLSLTLAGVTRRVRSGRLRFLD